MYNRNRVTILDPRYTQQQTAIKEACEALGLKAFYPNYHAAKNDDNTVLIYTQEDFDHNAEMDKYEREHGYRPQEDKKHICWFENTDINGQFSLNFLNRGGLVVCGLSPFELKLKIQAYLEEKLEAHNAKI